MVKPAIIEVDMTLVQGALERARDQLLPEDQ